MSFFKESLKLSILLIISSTYIASSSNVMFYENTNMEYQTSFSANTRNLADSHEREICGLVGSPVDMDELIDIIPNADPQNIAQGDCAQIFRVTITDAELLDKYLHFEINLEDPRNYLKTKPILIMTRCPADSDDCTEPIAYYNSDDKIIVHSEAQDENGYNNRKTYHHIVIEPEKVTIGTTFYFAFYKMFAKEKDYVKYTLNYDVSMSSSKDKPCPKNCNNKGVCNKGVCDCVPGIFDLDCSVEAQLVNFGEKTTSTILPYTWDYYYFTISAFDSSIVLKFTKSEGPMHVAFIFNKNKETDLPTDTDINKVLQLERDTEDEDFRISDQTLRIHLGEYLVIGAFNVHSSKVDLDIELEFSESETLTRTTIMYVMIGISTVLIILWGIITVIKYKVHRESEALLALQQTHQRESSDCLTPEEYDKYIPKTPYGELKSSFEQTTCSICLEEFHADTTCRQIYCEHIYHDTCIDSWLNSHPDCPNCKKKVTKTAIENHKNGKTGSPTANAIEGPNGPSNEPDDAPLITVDEERKEEDEGDTLQRDRKKVERNGQCLQEESKEEINSLREDEIMDDVILEFKDEPDRNVPEINQIRAQKTLAEVKGLGLGQTNSEQV